MAIKNFLPGHQLFDDEGKVLSNGLVYFYETGTTTDKDTYTTSDLDVANANPVELSAAGRPPVGIWLDGDYSVLVTKQNGTVLWSEDGINPDPDSVATRASYNYIDGLTLDYVNSEDLTLNIGACMDSANAVMMEFDTATTKLLDTAWAAGDAAGGSFDGTWANNADYYIHLIRNPTTGAVDWGSDTSVTAANAPSGYTQYRLIGFFRTQAAAAGILDFSCRETEGGGIEWNFASPTEQLSDNNPTTAIQSYVCTDSMDVNGVWSEVAFITYDANSSGNIFTLLFGVGDDDTAPAATDFSYHTAADAAGIGSGSWQGHIYTGASKTMRYRCSASDTDVTVYGCLHGWKWSRKVT